MNALQTGFLRLCLGCLLLLGVFACNKTPKDIKIELASVGETMAYDKKDLVVPAGSKVTISLKNNATSPVMTHNFVLVQMGKVNEVGAAAATVPVDKGYIPENAAIIAHSPLSKPGETVTVTFDAPPPGIYEFLCTTPGHFALMRGTFTVQ